MMPRNLILVRHGLSEANVIQAQDKTGDTTWFTEENMTYPDSSWRLAPDGVKQARVSGSFIMNEYQDNPLTRFIVSPFMRTRETAANLNIPYALWEENRAVRERSWGEIDSIPRTLFAEKYSYNHAYKKRSPLYWEPPAGESIAEVAENRVRNLLTTLHRENENDNVLVVTHGEFMWATRLVLERWSDEQFVRNDSDPACKIHNATVLEYTRINPYSGEETNRLQWLRLSYPAPDSVGQYRMVVGSWEHFDKPYMSNQQLHELVAQGEKRLF